MTAVIEELRSESNRLIAVGRLDLARPLWLKLCELEPEQKDNWLVLSAIDEKLGFFPAALGHLKYAFHLDADDPDIWLQAASLNWKMRRYDLAFENLYQGLARDFVNPDMRYQAAIWLLHVNNFEQALLHFHFLLKTDQFSQNHIVSALSCSYLQGDLSLCEAILKSKIITKEVVFDEVVKTIGQLVLPIEYDAKIKQLKAVSYHATTFFRDVEKQLKAQGIKALPNYFDYMAHTELARYAKPDRVFDQAIRDHIATVVEISSDTVPSVLEFGCGSGVFGESSSAFDNKLVLTGVEISEPALAIASKREAYANLISYGQWHVSKRLFENNTLCYVLRARIACYASRAELITQLLAQAGSVCRFIIEFNAMSYDRDDIELVIKDLTSDWRVEHDTVDEAGDDRSLIVVTRYLDAKKIKFIQTKAYTSSATDKPEMLANKLVAAQKTMLPKHDIEGITKTVEEVGEVYPNSAHGYFLRGYLAQDAKDYSAAIGYFRKALRFKFGYYDVWFQIATVWHALGRYQSMLRAYRQCLRFAPKHVMALKNLIAFYLSQGDWFALRGNLCRLLMCHPLNTELRKYAEEVIVKVPLPNVKQAYADFLESKDFKKAQFGSALELSYFVRCETLLEALTGLIEDKDIRLMRVNILNKSGQVKTALGLLEELIADFPDEQNYIKLKRSLQVSTGDLLAAQQTWEQQLETLDAKDSDLQGGLFVSNYYYRCTDEQVKKYHFDWGSGVSAAVNKGNGSFLPATLTNHFSGRKVRIGYVSGDFKMHSVSMFLYNIYKNHDREMFEIVSYSSHHVDDPMMIKLRLFSDLWRDISKLNDEQAARLIKRDNIDILVDLSGHTGHSRLSLFCYKPALIQGTYLGYANTTGLAEVNFRFTDEVADPGGLTDYLHTEKLIRLPNGFLSYSRHASSPPVVIAKEDTTVRSYTFVCCNNIQKVNFEVIRVFCEILKRVPDANMLIKAHNFNNPDILERYQQEFEQNGIGLDRVHLMNALDMEDHQELYNHTKIALDPYPYSGTTTTCDALWMGVPVVTFAGSRHSSRVSASILHRVGLDDWIANSEEEYIEKAVSFVNNAGLLEEIKLSMRYNMLNSPLMHPTKVCRDIEAAYQQLFVDHQNLVESES